MTFMIRCSVGWVFPVDLKQFIQSPCLLLPGNNEFLKMVSQKAPKTFQLTFRPKAVPSFIQPALSSLRGKGSCRFLIVDLPAALPRGGPVPFFLFETEDSGRWTRQRAQLAAATASIHGQRQSI